jgi:hypothetical protein
LSKKKHSGRNAGAMVSISFAATPAARNRSRQVLTAATTVSISFLAASVLSPKRWQSESRL